jgi:hypothetical protein
MLLLLTVGIRSYDIWVYSAAKMFISRFTQFGSLVQKLEQGALHRQICSVGKKSRLKWKERRIDDEKDGRLGVNIY